MYFFLCYVLGKERLGYPELLDIELLKSPAELFHERGTERALAS